MKRSRRNCQFVSDRCGIRRLNQRHYRYRQVAAALEAGVFKPNRVRIVPNGLAGVEGGLEELKANKVSAEKLVYRVADTPGLGERYSTA